MRLDNNPPQGRKPMRTVSEIAEILGIATTKLSHALTRPDAPKGVTAKSLGHTVAGKNRVWYEPKEVIRWYRTLACIPAVPPGLEDIEGKKGL
jgi:hypothetical protein